MILIWNTMTWKVLFIVNSLVVYLIKSILVRWIDIAELEVFQIPNTDTRKWASIPASFEVLFLFDVLIQDIAIT